MKVNLSVDNLIKFREEGYTVAPVSAEILSDIATPIESLKALREQGGGCFLFESVEGGEKWARYSFLGYKPKAEISLREGVITYTEGDSVRISRCADPDDFIRGILKDYRSPRIVGSPTFTGGLVGYFSYEYFRYAERAPHLKSGTDGDMRLYLFDKVVAYDNFRHKIIVTCNVPLDGDEQGALDRATAEIAQIIKLIKKGARRRRERVKISPFTAKYTEEEYAERVKRAKRYIYEGDIFQCVPSNRWTASIEGSLINCYRLLRTTNPSPYMIYLDFGDTEIAGASPETLVKVTDGKVQTFPIAGTRKRGATEEEDEALERELLADEKEGAEHDMLVDLGRNDLGKVCAFGTVEVKDYRKIYRYSHVMHITSSVSGLLKEGKDAVDALSATLPAGTLSGAPKLRATEIISELEDGEPRGVYGGAAGYFDFTGNADFCIAIRTAVRHGGEVTVRAGGGIVEGSDPRSEFIETVNKSAAVRLAAEGSAKVDI